MSEKKKAPVDRDKILSITAGVLLTVIVIVLLLVLVAGKGKKKESTKMVLTGKKNKKGLGKTKGKLNSTKTGLYKFIYFLNPSHWGKSYNPTGLEGHLLNSTC